MSEERENRGRYGLSSEVTWVDLEGVKGIVVTECGPYQRIEMVDPQGRVVNDPLDLVVHRLLEEGSPSQIQKGLARVAERYRFDGKG